MNNGDDNDLEYPRPDASLYAGDGRFAADLTKLEFGSLGYELGYRRAADVLYEHMRRNQGAVDCLVFPLAYLWLHAIELQMKRLIVRLIVGMNGTGSVAIV